MNLRDISIISRTIAFSTIIFLTISCSEKPDQNNASDTLEIGELHLLVEGNNRHIPDLIPKDEYLNMSAIFYRDSINGEIVNETKGKIRGRGNTTWHTAKKPYQIKLDSSQSIAGFPAAKKWILLANYYDKTMLRNSIAFELSKLSNLDFTPNSKFYNVTINNDWRGIYLLTEKIELQKNRIPKQDRFLLEMTPVNRMNDEDIYVRSQHYQFEVKEPDLSIDDPKYIELEKFIVDTENAFLTSNVDDYTTYKQYIDLNTLVDWYLIQEITRNNDANFYSSVYMTWEPGEKLKLGPIWDYDVAFGNINYGESYKTEGLLFEKNHWLKHILSDPEFIKLRKERYAYFYSKKEHLIELIEQYGEALEKDATRNHEKYNLLGRKVWPNRVAHKTYKEDVIDLKNWLTMRMNYLNEEFVLKQ